MAAPKVRRTISMTPQTYKLAIELSALLGEPMTRIVDRLLTEEGARRGLTKVTHAEGKRWLASRGPQVEAAPCCELCNTRKAAAGRCSGCGYLLCAGCLRACEQHCCEEVEAC